MLGTAFLTIAAATEHASSQAPAGQRVREGDGQAVGSDLITAAVRDALQASPATSTSRGAAAGLGASLSAPCSR